MTLMHAFGVPAGKFVLALGLTLGVLSHGAFGQGASPAGGVPPAGNLPDPATIIMQQNALDVAMRSTSNPERCSGLQPGQNANNTAAQTVDQLVNGRLAAIPGAIVEAGRITQGIVSGSGAAGLISCPGPGADGACPALPSTVGELPACTDVSPGGRFNEADFERLLRPIHEAGCAASCRRTAAEAAKLQMSCLGEEYQKLKESMNSIEDTIKQNLDNQRKYVEAVEAEATRQEAIEMALVGGPEGGGKFADLQRVQSDLDGVVTNFQSQIPLVQQAIRQHQQDQEIYTQAIQRATVERTNRCFMTEIPPGMSVGPCNRGGGPPRSGLEFIMCRHRQSLEGSTNAGNVVRAQAQQRTELLSNFINQKFGAGTRFGGAGDIEDPGSGQATDGGANGRSFGTNMGDLRAELESVIVQSGASGNAVAWLRDLQTKCERQATSQITKELASTGSKPGQWRRRMERDATNILSGTSATPGAAPAGGVIAMISRQAEAVRRAHFALTNQELGANFQPESCTSISSTNNSGGATFAQANLSRASSCILGLQATVNCLSTGSNCGAQGNSLQAVSVPGVGDVPCRFMRECMAAVQQKAMEARSMKASLRGDSTFRDPRCANGECLGKKKFIREASRKLMDAVRVSSRAFNGHAASLKNQMAALTARLQRGLRISLPRTRATTRQTWPCPNPPGGGTGGAEPQICELPTPNTGDLIASLTQPVTPEDPAETFSSTEGKLDEALTAAQAMEDRVLALRGREAGKKAECQASEARRAIANARRDLENAYTECQQAHARRDTLCSEGYINRLQGSFQDIARVAAADASGQEESNQYQNAQQRLRTICHSERTVGQINDHTFSCGQDDANKDAAQDERVCGSNGHIDRAGLLGQGAIDVENNRVTRRHTDRETGRDNLDCVYTGGEGACAVIGTQRNVLTRKCDPICPADKPEYDADFNRGATDLRQHCHVKCEDPCFPWSSRGGRCQRDSASTESRDCQVSPSPAAAAAPPGAPAAPTAEQPATGTNPATTTGGTQLPAGAEPRRANGLCPPGTIGRADHQGACITVEGPNNHRRAVEGHCRSLNPSDTNAYQACVTQWHHPEPAPAAAPAPAAPARHRSRR